MDAYDASDLIDWFFPDDIADELLAFGDGADEVICALKSAADHLELSLKLTVLQLSLELTNEDRSYIRGEYGRGPMDAGVYLAQRIEAGAYLHSIEIDVVDDVENDPAAGITERGGGR